MIKTLEQRARQFLQQNMGVPGAMLEFCRAELEAAAKILVTMTEKGWSYSQIAEAIRERAK